MNFIELTKTVLTSRLDCIIILFDTSASDGCLDKKALCLIAPGFEDIEFVTPVDILRRAGVNVTIASIAGQ